MSNQNKSSKIILVILLCVMVLATIFSFLVFAKGVAQLEPISNAESTVEPTSVSEPTETPDINAQAQ